MNVNIGADGTHWNMLRLTVMRRRSSNCPKQRLDGIKMQGLLISSLLAAATVFGDAPLIPFVAVTGRPTAADCARRVEGLAKAGFGGLIVYPRSGLEYEYMGAEWLDTVAAFCQAAERKGLEVWLYDEFNWPSGTCKGRVPQEKSEFRYQEMAFYRNPDGTFRHAVAYGPETWVNPYSFGATKRFIELTHEKYAKRLARWFENKTVRGIFSDEPGSPAKVCLDGPAAVHFRWYDGLDADYRKLIILSEDRLVKGQVLKGFADRPEVMELYNRAWDKIKAMEAR